MDLEGWNSIPQGSTAAFNVGAAPWWLRGLLRTPFVDRFAYPLLVRRGLGALDVVDPDVFDGDSALAEGWRILPREFIAPGSWRRLEKPEDPTR